MNTPTHALSLHQPYASLVVHGIKTFETRSWPVPHTIPLPTRIYVHATLHEPEERNIGSYRVKRGDDNHDYFLVKDATYADNPHGSLVVAGPTAGTEATYLPRGAVLGEVTIAACLPILLDSGEPGDAGVHTSLSDGTLRYANPQTGDYRDISDQRPYGWFRPLGFAYELVDPQRYDTPISAKGRQRFWPWHPALPEWLRDEELHAEPVE